MDFTKGMECPSCGKHNVFMGGQFSGSGQMVNYNCDCGFSGTLVIPLCGREIVVRFIKPDENPYIEKNLEDLLVLNHQYKKAEKEASERRDRFVSHTLRDVLFQIEKAIELKG